MSTKISYSGLNTYEQCPFKYKLVYVDKHFIEQNTIATCFGTLVHYIEETIANKIKNGEVIDYTGLLSLFYTVEDSKEKLFGINKLKEMFPEDYYVEDKNGLSYADKEKIYCDTGIYRLENYLKENPNLQVYGAEIPFTLEYGEYIFRGFVDRVFFDKAKQCFHIEDIKTYSAPIEEAQLKTPLQFVVYALALSKELKLDPDNFICAYDLPLCSTRQEAGTKGYIKRGQAKIDRLLHKIDERDFKPKGSPLCHWCVFCKTYPNQPEEAKNLCPYFCH